MTFKELNFERLIIASYCGKLHCRSLLYSWLSPFTSPLEEEEYFQQNAILIAL